MRHTHQLWIWLALDRHTRKIVSCFMGQRDAVRAFGLWAGLPTLYLDAVCYTGRLGVYKGVVFGALRRIGGTQQMERFNATLRVRLSHLVHRTLSFSRKLANLEMLILLFLHRYNASFP